MSMWEMKGGGEIAHGRLAKAISKPPSLDIWFCTKESSRGVFAKALGRTARLIAANAAILIVRWWFVTDLESIVEYLSYYLLACLNYLTDDALARTGVRSSLYTSPALPAIWAFCFFFLSFRENFCCISPAWMGYFPNWKCVSSEA